LFFLGCAWGLCGVLSLGFFWFVGDGDSCFGCDGFLSKAGDSCFERRMTGRLAGMTINYSLRGFLL
jgi:hypothetical protein